MENYYIKIKAEEELCEDKYKVIHFIKILLLILNYS